MKVCRTVIPADNPAMASTLEHPRVLPAQELGAVLAEKRAGKQVVFTNGCFDILHPGHVDLLARARFLGDMLVVGLNTDASVRRLGKNDDVMRPVNTLSVRAYVLAHLASVDYVTWFDEDTPAELVAMLVPDVLVKGGDWSVENIVGRDTVEAAGGQVHSLPLLPGYSTTGLIAKIRSG